MSLLPRENARARGLASCNGFARRMVNLPRTIIGGFSRALGHGITMMGASGRRDQHQRENFQQPPEPLVIPEEWVFLASFEQQYGFSHPFFYACRFVEALKIAEDEHKFVFMYLHSPNHPFTASFCSNTLCSELVVQFLDANFVCWGALESRGEGLQMATEFRAASFPFCAIVAPASGNSIAVLQQVEGAVSPAELVEILQRVIEEQGSAFGAAGATQEVKRRADRRLQEEQDAAYLAALHIDQEKDRIRELHVEQPIQKPVEVKDKGKNEKLQQGPATKQHNKVKEKETAKATQRKEIALHGKDPEVTQILIRFPNGERREQSFLCTDKIQSVYKHIDSLGLPGIGSYRLISSFPRKVYGLEQMGMTLKDAGLHPRASLFLELL